MDIETVIRSIKKTGRLIGASEAYENTGFINEVLVQVNELAFDWLDAPMVRVAAAQCARSTCRDPERSRHPERPTAHRSLSKGGELMAVEFFIPKLGQTVEEVTIVTWLVEDGAKVEQGQPIVEVETDKAVFPVEATASGFLHRGPFKEGDVVPVVTTVAIIGGPTDRFIVKGIEMAEPVGRTVASVSAPEGRPAEVIPTTSAELETSDRLAVSPRARRLAIEKKVDLHRVKPKGDWQGSRQSLLHAQYRARNS